MGRRVLQADAATFGQQSPWCGRIAWQVSTEKGSSLGELEVRVGHDDVSIFFAGRNLGCVPRDLLHGWAQRPSDTFQVDDVRLAMRGRTLLMALDAVSPPFVVPTIEAQQILLAV